MSDSHSLAEGRGDQPRPGQHLAADPEQVRAEVGRLLHGAETGSLTERAQLFGQAHDVLVRALSTVDKY